jgi:glutamine amidotransferase
MKSAKNILVIDYGVGNHESIVNVLRYFKQPFKVSYDADQIYSASSLILPGVGAFKEAMKNLRQRNLVEIIYDAVKVKRIPILGICLGMQILAESSIEGGFCEGLGLINGTIEELDRTLFDHVPHVGWNNLCIKQRSPYFDFTYEENDFYFDHSYHIITKPTYQAASCLYGRGEITAAVQHDHILGVQFHPEKSQNAGLRFFRNYLNYLDKYRPTEMINA